MTQLTSELINGKVIPKIRDLFKTKKYIKGSSLIKIFMDEFNLNHDLAEDVLKLMIGEGVLLNTERPKDLYSDYFILNNEIINNYKYSAKPELKLDEVIETQDTKTENLGDSSEILVIPVLEVPPYMAQRIEGEFIKQKEIFKKLITNAQKEIKIISPFVDEVGISNYIYEIIQQCSKGVKIKFLTRKDSSTERAINILKASIKDTFGDTFEIRSYHKLDDRGLVQSVHSKLIICDDREAYVGSGEIRKNSLFGFLCESGVYIVGERVVRVYSSFFNAIWGDAESI